MQSTIRSITTIAVAASLLSRQASAADNETKTAITGRYWDCCKPSCAWNGKADFSNPIPACDAQNNPLTDVNIGTSCNGGTAFACANQSPWAVNDTFAFGFAGTFLMGQIESDWCGSCYELQFTSGNLTGKKMIVQTTNTDYDVLDNNLFTLNIPGGNNADYGSCAAQYNLDSSTFGTNSTGVSTRADCDNLPEAQRSGCQFRFDFLRDTLNPDVNFKRVTCPSELTNLTGTIRKDDTTFESAGTSFESRLLLQSFLAGTVALWLMA